ncbi:hypothetical protein LXL04_024754 [Taraxacum kok-saghyz]
MFETAIEIRFKGTIAHFLTKPILLLLLLLIFGLTTVYTRLYISIFDDILARLDKEDLEFNSCFNQTWNLKFGTDMMYSPFLKVWARELKLTGSTTFQSRCQSRAVVVAQAIASTFSISSHETISEDKRKDVLGAIFWLGNEDTRMKSLDHDNLAMMEKDDALIDNGVAWNFHLGVGLNMASIVGGHGQNVQQNYLHSFGKLTSIYNISVSLVNSNYLMHTHALMYTCTYTFNHLCTPAHMHLCAYAHIRILYDTHMHTCTHAHMRLCTHTMHIFKYSHYLS